MTTPQRRIAYRVQLRLNALLVALDDVELGAHEEEILNWAAETLDDRTVATLASWLHRAQQPDVPRQVHISSRGGVIAATAVVAAVAVIVSYDRHAGAGHAGRRVMEIVAYPVGHRRMVVGASTVLLARRRAGQPGSVLALLGGSW